MSATFLKWAGGKAKLAPRVVQRLPAAFGRYHEPFLGGGAVYFALCAAGRAGSARLADSNADLVECFGMVRDRTEDLIEVLLGVEAEYLALDPDGRRACYLAHRAAIPRDPVERAARLIFLNHTCYNGLYRVNAKGQFNVPHGRYVKPRIADVPGLRAAAACLDHAELACEDFEAACAHARRGDLVYLDPPYYPLSATSHFTAYTANAFGPGEHERLRDCFEALTRRGVAAILSNSEHPAVRELYEGRGYCLDVVEMSRAINSVGSGRSRIPELLIDNFERPEVLPALAGAQGHLRLETAGQR